MANMNNLLNEENDGYVWEGDYEQTWAAVQEDEYGTLHASFDEGTYKMRKKNIYEKQKNVRLSMMRHMFLVVDLSQFMLDKDLKPNRIVCVIRLLEKFVFKFFDQNPVSQLGVIVTRNKTAEKLTELLGNPKRIVDKLKLINEKICQGEPSLQNSLELALGSLKHVKSHCSKEVLFVMGSLTTCDSGDIFTTIDECKKQNVRCSFIGLSAEVFVFRNLCEETNGVYSVILDELHFNEILKQISLPLPNTDVNTETLIRMGFPQHKICQQEEASMCMCHLDSDKTGFSTGGYFCPQCDSKYCEIPIECKACGLTLVCAPHLARSYHHLFQLNTFDEYSPKNVSEAFLQNGHCFSCQCALKSENLIFKCNKCDKLFCMECDLFIHETVHSCPGCCMANLQYD